MPCGFTLHRCVLESKGTFIVVSLAVIVELQDAGGGGVYMATIN